VFNYLNFALYLMKSLHMLFVRIFIVVICLRWIFVIDFFLVNLLFCCLQFTMPTVLLSLLLL